MLIFLIIIAGVYVCVFFLTTVQRLYYCRHCRISNCFDTMKNTVFSFVRPQNYTQSHRAVQTKFFAHWHCVQKSTAFTLLRFRAPHHHRTAPHHINVFTFYVCQIWYYSLKTTFTMEFGCCCCFFISTHHTAPHLFPSDAQKWQLFYLLKIISIAHLNSHNNKPHRSRDPITWWFMALTLFKLLCSNLVNAEKNGNFVCDFVDINSFSTVVCSKLILIPFRFLSNKRFIHRCHCCCCVCVSVRCARKWIHVYLHSREITLIYTMEYSEIYNEHIAYPILREVFLPSSKYIKLHCEDSISCSIW